MATQGAAKRAALKIKHRLSGYIAEQTNIEDDIADIIDAEFARDPVRMQSRTAIERACTNATDAAAQFTSWTDWTRAAVRERILAAFSLQPCGHLVTSLVERDGKPVCEQCELEGEIVGGLLIGKNFAMCEHHHARTSIYATLCVGAETHIDALLAKLQRKE